MTVIVKKTDTPIICKPSRCYHLAYDSICFVSYFERGLVEHHFLEERIKTYKLNTRFEVLGIHFFPLCKKGFWVQYKYSRSDCSRHTAQNFCYLVSLYKIRME